MLNEKKILTRAKLFELVWATPMFVLAKQFQLSDNGLRKVCRKYMIPIPKMGYWQKVRFGKTPKKPLLPAYQGEDKIIIKMMPRIKETLEPSQIVSEVIPVPEHISKFHPLIKQAKDLFKEGYKDKGRFRAARSQRALDIRVGSEQLSRAFRIMDTVIKALEERGVQVTIGSREESDGSTCANIDNEKVEFILEESLKIVKGEPQKYSYSQQEFVPSGNLSLHIKNYLSGCQTKWADGKEKKLEQKITSFLNGLFFAAAYLKKESLRREEESKRWAEERKENERKAQELEEEKKKIQMLEQQAESWQKSRLIKALVRDAVKRQGAYSSSSFDKWVTRAKAYAEQLDPLRSLPLNEGREGS